MKVLVVEDTVTSATLICHQLGKMGLESVHARNGETGIEVFKRERPDIVLLDIIMPGPDGFEVCKRLRQLEKDGEWTPIIFLTARTSDADLEKGIAVGGDDYLIKPVSEMVLTAKIRAMQRIVQMRHSLVVLTRKLDEANRELSRLSAVDGLTGIANRRSFDDALVREWRRAMRTRTPVGLILVDVDNFKQYNDHYGHQMGDECLKAVAATLDAQPKRSADLVARYGGEEFVAILPDTDPEGAMQVAEQMRCAVERLALPHAKAQARDTVTISVGVASAAPESGDASGFVRLLQDADKALYAAKGSGRNRAVLARMGTPATAASV